MKKMSSSISSLLLTLVIVLLAQSGYSQTNVYYPIPTQNMYWRESQGGACGNLCRDYQNFTTGDTLISGQLYTKIQNSGVSYNSDYNDFCTNIIWQHYSYLAGAVRNDSINRKVYDYIFDNHAESLLYDFNLNLGDTLPPAINNGWSAIVSGIDSVFVGNNYHKRFIISNYEGGVQPVYLIEGIGSSSGFLNGVFFCFECCAGLLCVKDDGNIIYSDGGPCNPIEGISDNPPPEISCKILPNPCEGTARVSFNPQLEKVSLCLYDVLGQVSFSKSDLNNEQQIDLSFLRSGFYYYVFLTSNKIISNGKFIRR